MKPYLRLAYGLIILGIGLLMLEQFGLGALRGQHDDGVRLDPTIWSLLVIVPVALVIAGCLVFMVGKMRRL